MTSVDRCPACGATSVGGMPAIVRHCGEKSTTCRWVKCINLACQAVIYPARGIGFTLVTYKVLAGTKQRVQRFTFRNAA